MLDLERVLSQAETESIRDVHAARTEARIAPVAGDYSGDFAKVKQNVNGAVEALQEAMRALKEIMKAEFINPFVTAGMQVLESVIQSAPDPGQLAVRSATFTTQQVSIVIGVTGAVEGHAVYGMPLVTAAKIAAAITSTPIMTFDETAGNAIVELGNMVSGNAATLLSEAGYECELTPPTLIRGADVEVSTSTPALVVPLYTDFGKVEINVALRESTGRPAPAAAPEPEPAPAPESEPTSEPGPASEPEPPSVPEPAPTSEPGAAPELEPADSGPADNQPSDNPVTKPEEEQS